MGLRWELCCPWASGGRQTWTVLQMELGDQGLAQALTSVHPCHLGPRQQVRGYASKGTTSTQGKDLGSGLGS